MDLQCDNFDQLLTYVNSLAEEMLKTTIAVHAAEVGLDYRCGHLYVGQDFVAIPKSMKRIVDYYGGFEYVDKEYVHTIGEYVFYQNGSNRIERIIDKAYGNEDEEDDDGED